MRRFKRSGRGMMLLLLAVTLLAMPAGMIFASESGQGYRPKTPEQIEAEKAEKKRKAKEAERQRQAEAERKRKAEDAEKKRRAEERRHSGGTQSESIVSINVNGVTFEMVRVEGGSFMMGSSDPDADSDEKPVHAENVATFYIGRTEVTQALWQAVMGSNPSYFKGGSLPVENVSWNDCQAFCERLRQLTGRQFRLPTEVEWEYAARGGNRSRGYKYSGGNDLSLVGWNTDNSGSATHPVGSKQANELGIYDMSGNVWEWTSDLYYSSYRNGGSRGSNRVNRGGGWLNDARYCRSSYRDYNTPGGRGGSLGLRLAF